VSQPAFKARLLAVAALRRASGWSRSRRSPAEKGSAFGGGSASVRGEEVMLTLIGSGRDWATTTPE